MPFQEITVTPLICQGSSPRFHLLVSGKGNSEVWTRPGVYESAEAIVESFSPGLRKSLKNAILSILAGGEQIHFSLENAFEGFGE